MQPINSSIAAQLCWHACLVIVIDSMAAPGPGGRLDAAETESSSTTGVDDSPPPKTEELSPHDHPLVLGPASCSSVNCHGAASGPSWKTSYTVWITQDPHARAYDKLFASTSREIVRQLNRGNRLTPSAYRAYILQHCAACHATVRQTTRNDHTVVTDALQVPYGVSCESCHGPAGAWLNKHVKRPPDDLPAWPKSRFRVTEDLDWQTDHPDGGLAGLIDTSDQVTRVHICAGCHVGASASENIAKREVDHDLIAAGHPRLNFEFTSHFANLPSHWKPPTKDRALPDAPRQAVLAWQIAQLVSADAALDLLQLRLAGDRWPEFSEYDCFSCHHALQVSGWRHQQAYLKRRSPQQRGTYTWGSWYFSMFDDTQLRDTIGDLAAAMRDPIPDKKRVHTCWQAVRQDLRREIRRWSQEGASEMRQRSAADLLGSVGQRLDSPLHWDEVAQSYLLLSYLDAETTLFGARPKNPALVQLFNQIQTRPDSNSPRDLHPVDLKKALAALQDERDD